MRIVASDPKDAAAADLIQALDDETQHRYPGEPVFGIDADGFLERGGIFLLGFVEGAAIACGALRQISHEVYEVKRMYVRPEYRGRGLSRLTFNRLEGIARDKGSRKLLIETGNKQPEALALYRSVGFTEIDRFGEYIENEYSICFAKCVLDFAELDFLRSFETCTLPEREWTHLAHIRMAWLYLTQTGSAVALDRIRGGILRYNTEVLGRRQEYHDTVTEAFTRLISDRMMPGEVWTSFSRRIDDFMDRESPILETYYSRELLGSARAKEHFVDPDLCELPMFHDVQTV